jgi:hypothetical protein
VSGAPQFGHFSLLLAESTRHFGHSVLPSELVNRRRRGITPKDGQGVTQAHQPKTTLSVADNYGETPLFADIVPGA